ncbi:heat shock protein Hsp20 [Desulfovibrio sp. X2]|uniref:Hsp20/alpha crystallin family protein n=1 Tax=Desulfovibrio sp. X2 TaxID=941449 RepID=UPI000358DF86|nr:Hsp20/alpha crystallin family protein [Desulfovibrio sp. X2]EPR43382.1 heat shock protein Hsp20 [Desulfovibrio sp. X2]
MAELKIWGESQIELLRRDMDQLFAALCDDFGLPPLKGAAGMRVRLDEAERLVVVEVDLPGFSGDEIEVAATERSLAVTARSAGGGASRSLKRSIGLPVAVEPSGARAAHDGRTLTVTLPRRAGTVARLSVTCENT